MNNKKKISILGCGWLGIPLAKYFIKQGHSVKGSTTTPTKIPLLKDIGIDAFLIKLDEITRKELYQDFLKDSDIIIIGFPPKRIEDIEKIYPSQVKSILGLIGDQQKIIFTSSTSVYQNTNDWVTEELENKPQKTSGKAVLASEQLLEKHLGNRLTILRLSGLIGYDRLPGRFLANKKAVANGNAPINVIHQDDCVGLINAIVEKNIWGEIINGCSDKHPTREQFYTIAAKNIGLTPPEFQQNNTEIAFKKISNLKSKELLKYKYIHPNPLSLI